MTFCRSRKWLVILSTIMMSTMISVLPGCGDAMYHPPAIVVTFDAGFPPPSTLNTDGVVGIAADITNDSQNAGVTFSCSPGGACGSFTPPGAANAVPTCYQAPATIPTGGTVTVTATSVTDPSKSVSATINIINGPGGSC
jgi:hypothetical protein